MGWCLYIRTANPVPPEVVEQALTAMREPFSRQSWGWSAAVDISPDPVGLRTSGSYTASGHIRIEFTRRLRNELSRMGYDPKAVSSWAPGGPATPLIPRPVGWKPPVVAPHIEVFTTYTVVTGHGRLRGLTSSQLSALKEAVRDTLPQNLTARGRTYPLGRSVGKTNTTLVIQRGCDGVGKPNGVFLLLKEARDSISLLDEEWPSFVEGLDHLSPYQEPSR